MATRSNKNNSVNDNDLVDWIIREEGFNTKPEDIGDGKVTLGSGLTDPKWHALYKKRGNKWSEEDNRRAVAEEVANRRKWAEKTIPNWEALPDSSQKALLSYKYNYDFTPTNSPKLFQALADSNLKEAARQMDATSKDPKFKKGLQERRQREQEWFLSEVEPEPEPFQVVSNIIHEEIPVSTVVSTPYRTAVNNPAIPTTMIPDGNSYITTHRITPSEDRSNRVQEALNGISDYSRLMNNTSIINNPIPQYSPNTNIKYAEGGYLNSNNNNQPIYKDWNSLSMREKSEYMKTAIRNGITTLSDIKQAYNQFASGGNKKEISSTTPFWQKPIIPFRQRNEVIITPDSEYNRYLNTLPDNQRFTPNDKYDSYLYWKLNGRPKDFKEAHDKEMFTYDNSDHAYHANSVAWEDEDTGYFMKPKDHDTVKYELDWFNKGLVTEEGGWQRPETLSEWRESKDFRNDYDLLDDPNRPNFYMYKHKKKAEGGNLYKKGGSKDEGYNNFVAYTQRAEGTHWQGQQDKFKREKGKSATQYYWDEAKKRYKDKWDKWTPSQRIAVADTMYNYGYWDGTFDAYKYDMNVKGVDNDAYWKKYGKGHTRRFNERKKMFYGNEVPEMIAAPKDANIRIPSVQEYAEPFIPTFMPSNPEAFFTPLESYQRPVIEEVVEQPLVKAANAYSQEALDREQRQRNLNTLNFVLGMTSPQGSDNSFVNTIGMLTGNINANGGNIHIKPSHRGKLTELKKRTGKSEAELYKTGGPAVRKMITFARNARKWKHGLGGNLYDGTTEDSQQMVNPYRPNGGFYYVNSKGQPVNPTTRDIIELPDIVVAADKNSPSWYNRTTVGGFDENGFHESWEGIQPLVMSKSEWNRSHSANDLQTMDPYGEIPWNAAAIATGFLAPELAYSHIAKGAQFPFKIADRYFGAFGKPQVPKGYSTLKPQTRTRVGDVEMDDPNLLYHLDRGDGAGAFSNQGAYVADSFLMPGTPKDASAIPYSWWNEGKPYSTSVNGQPMTRLMTATKDTPGMTHVRSQNYPIGQWNGKRGFVLNSEYVNPERVNVSGNTYTLDPNYGWRRNLAEDIPTISWAEATTPQITAENAASITPEQWNAAYRAAYERGDKAEGQRLWDLWFDIKAVGNKALYEGDIIKNGEYISGKNLPDFYHNTDASFTSFDVNKTGQNWEQSLRGNKRGVYLSAHDPKSYYGKNEMKLKLYSENPEVVSEIPKEEAFSVSQGKDAIWEDFGMGQGPEGEVFVLDPRRIKSAEPFTLADDGSLIDLSERANFNISDIRYGLLPFLGLGTAGTLYGKNKKGRN